MWAGYAVEGKPPTKGSETNSEGLIPKMEPGFEKGTTPHPKPWCHEPSTLNPFITGAIWAGGVPDGVPCVPRRRVLHFLHLSPLSTPLMYL